jgi:hypothetical protein
LKFDHERKRYGFWLDQISVEMIFLFQYLFKLRTGASDPQGIQNEGFILTLKSPTMKFKRMVLHLLCED